MEINANRPVTHVVMQLLRQHANFYKIIWHKIKTKGWIFFALKRSLFYSFVVVVVEVKEKLNLSGLYTLKTVRFFFCYSVVELMLFNRFGQKLTH